MKNKDFCNTFCFAEVEEIARAVKSTKVEERRDEEEDIEESLRCSAYLCCKQIK